VRQGLQYPGVLLKKVALLRAWDTRASRLAFHKFIQARQPVRPARRINHRTLNQGCTRNEGVKQVRARLHQRLSRKRERIPQAAGMFPGDGPCSPPGFDVARQQPQDLVKGQVGIADPGVSIAVPAGDDQISMGISRAG